MGVTIGKVTLLPLEVTTEVTSGFVDGFFGVPTEKEKTKPKTPPPKMKETSPPHHEEKKTIHRDKYGNIIPD